MEFEAISVIVMAYNSENTILDTLESVYRQTYKVLKLIINDDASQDNTVKIIEKWIKEKEKRFLDIKFIKNPVNKGTQYSFRNALLNCNTKWAKEVAGDDILLDDCISENYKYVLKHNINSILYSIQIPFMQKGKEKIRLRNDKYELWYIQRICGLAPKEQYKQLLRKDILFSPTHFICIDMYKELPEEKFEIEHIRNIEDWPMRLNITGQGYALNFMARETVMYRIGQSVSNSVDEYYRVAHLKQIKQIKKYLVYPNISKWHLSYYINEMLIDVRCFLIIKMFKNKRTSISKTVNYIFMILDGNGWKKFFFNILHE